MIDYLNTTKRSVAWIKSAHDAGRLETKPPFQRNLVWKRSHQSFLIDTILRSYPIPEVYMQESVTSEGQERYIVVDGQQRMRACLEFIDGGFALDPSQCPDRPDARFQDLTKEDRKKIFGYNFIVRQLPPIPEEELRHLFTRLNRNSLVLNSQELRHATYCSDFIQCMESLAEADWWATSGIFTVNDVRRMLDVEFISEITIGHLHGLQNKKSTLDKWYATYKQAFPARSKVVNTFDAVLEELSHILPTIRTTRWRKKSDFHTLFLVLAAHADSFPLWKARRKRTSATLIEFGEKVDLHLSGAASGKSTVKRYAEAVKRAASDLGNRRARAIALEAELRPLLGT